MNLVYKLSDIIEVFKLLILSDQHSENPNIKLTLIQHKDSW